MTSQEERQAAFREQAALKAAAKAEKAAAVLRLVRLGVSRNTVAKSLGMSWDTVAQLVGELTP